MDQVNNLLHIIEVNIEAWDNVEKPAPTKERAQFILSLVAEEVEPVSDLSDGVQMIAKEMVETHDGVLMTFASRLSALLAAHPSPQASPDAGEKCPIFIAEKYADNGALSHWDVIVKDTGDTVASYPPDDHPTDGWDKEYLDTLRELEAELKGMGTPIVDRSSEIEFTDDETGNDPNKSCVWSEDEDGAWHTGCGNIWEFSDGGPRENRAWYCPYCGHPMSLQEYKDPLYGEGWEGEEEHPHE